MGGSKGELTPHGIVTGWTSHVRARADLATQVSRPENRLLHASTFLYTAVSRLEAHKRGHPLGNEVPCSISAHAPRNMTAHSVGASTLVQLRDLIQPDFIAGWSPVPCSLP